MIDIIWICRKRNRKILGGKSYVNKGIIRISILWDIKERDI